MNNLRTRLITATALAIAAVAVAVVGYLGVSSELEVAFQLPYLASAGIVSLLLGGAAAALVLGAQLQRDSRRFDELEESVRLLASEVERLADLIETPADLPVVIRR